MRDLAELGRLADENLLGTWVAQGRHGGTVAGSGGCSFVVTGIPAAFFNGVFSAGPVDDPGTVVGAASTFSWPSTGCRGCCGYVMASTTSCLPLAAGPG